jgi:endonuclease/exonuclease/phosphatase (EEP) superfamily protein YafD
MALFLALLTAFVVLATLLPLSHNAHWAVRGWDFPRLQLAVLAALLLITQGIALEFNDINTWLMCTAVLICLGWQLWWILPYTRLWHQEVKAATDHSVDRQLSIITANVLMHNRNAGQLLALVQQHQPDVLVTLESDQWWQTQLDCLEATMPYSIKCPLDNLYGMHVYSRLPLQETDTAFLVQDDVPSMHALLTLRSGDSVRVHFMHPAPPSPTENTRSAERDAELVIVARSIADSRQPTIVTGDLNDVAWSRTTRLFRKISGLLDPRVGRGMFNTFHASYPFMRWPLDHLFHSTHFTVHSIARLPSIGSDHFALMTKLAFTPAQNTRQQGLDAERDDQALAHKIARAQRVSKADVPTPGENQNAPQY